jgi:hypothetical protein
MTTLDFSSHPDPPLTPWEHMELVHDASFSSPVQPEDRNHVNDDEAIPVVHRSVDTFPPKIPPDRVTKVQTIAGLKLGLT